ncbi:MAG: GNAT family N-acetyltransferase [Planctomycetaceae bacterium]|nr:GNAT family N-acetyltransferase [Planctomycetaceae bacterium]
MSLPILSTVRLSLSPVTYADINFLHQLWTLPEVRKFLWDDEVISLELARETVEGFLRDAETDGLGLWLISQCDAPETAVGFTSLRHPAGSEEVELLYGLHPDVWGRGLATEASRAVLDYCFDVLQLMRVVAGADQPHVLSLAVMKRLGMSPLPGGIPRVPGADYYVLHRDEYRIA